MNRDVTVTLSGKNEFSHKHVEYDADCVVVHAFSEFTDEKGNAAVDINTEIAGNMDASDLVESMASATGVALWGIAKQVAELPDSIFGMFVFKLMEFMKTEIEKEGKPCTETS